MTTVPQEAVKAAASAIRRAGDTYTEMAQAALTAALPHLPGVGVKKLEWGDARITEDGREAEDATSPVGRYIATDTGWFLLGQTGYEAERGLYQAKAAAQADYEARILSALEPSAVRELALEERLQAIEQQLVVNLGYFHNDKRILLETLQSHIISHIAAIRALSSPDHADAGKVEGDGWQQIESAPRDGTVIQAWHQVHKCPVSVLWKDGGFPYGGERLNWYERSYTTAWPERAFTHWRPLPSAPSQEVAGS
ncbi:hypothetical protein F9K96_05315 [Brucella anthropi]|uniref:hypothetical protein n=1 Tax=Brucella anthropi TaxID=529 RepID=UPI00124C1DE6|nr:hypothetical protein [Brucella anthropi]KAB2792563.1 hypothetical protein F9K96_05315 [Brucella anthropi]